MSLLPASAGDGNVTRITARTVGLLVLFAAASNSHAGEVEVFVADRDGNPVGDVAVYAIKPGAGNALPAPSAHAVMDQKDKQFVPHLLVVQTGTPVDFPNSDTVAHHVYSFSHPNKFMLPMYKGDPPPPVTFEYSGVVSLGCNIHDHMLGFILVVDSNIFTKTDENGRASLSLDDPEDYQIRIWSPRIRDGEELLSKTVPIPGASKPQVSFQLASKLNPPFGGPTGSELWTGY
jgi:plastocyanin